MIHSKVGKKQKLRQQDVRLINQNKIKENKKIIFQILFILIF